MYSITQWMYSVTQLSFLCLHPFTPRKEWGMYSVTILSVSASFFIFYSPPPPKWMCSVTQLSFLCLHLFTPRKAKWLCSVTLLSVCAPSSFFTPLKVTAFCHTTFLCVSAPFCPTYLIWNCAFCPTILFCVHACLKRDPSVLKEMTCSHTVVYACLP